MNSLQLAARCYNEGLLSKEAMVRVVRTRDRLIKQAIAEKVAGSGGWDKVVGLAQKLLPAMAGGAAAVGMGAGISGLVRHHKDKELKGKIEKSYRSMYKEYPKLSEMDKGKVSRHFGVLARYAPSLASDPMVAGSWVQSTTQMGHVDPDSIKRLSDTQSAIDKAHESRSLIQPGQFTAGMKLTGSALAAAAKAAGG